MGGPGSGDSKYRGRRNRQYRAPIGHEYLPSAVSAPAAAPVVEPSLKALHKRHRNEPWLLTAKDWLLLKADGVEGVYTQRELLWDIEHDVGIGRTVGSDGGTGHRARPAGRSFVMEDDGLQTYGAGMNEDLFR